ncbi:hypothetical protein QR297_16940 [Pseudomonas shirazica]|uniref:Lipoprotein n=1 Tax=Pseudomonas shirazica TaxID=1940636 RepID=A0ABY9SJD4_9PSED|nr:hypothetical protein [Pseudomonas shirazica]WMY83651.1 hypothetical protein QR297_16940 [Pseudomonas shirazica]
MRVTFQSVFVASALLLSGCDDSTSKARIALEAQMTDPQSAQYRNEQVKPWGIVCGEANVKNYAGGYIGFTPYIAFPMEGEDWTAVVMDDKNYDYVSPLCAKSPIDLYKAELLPESEKGWYVMLLPPPDAHGILDPQDLEKLNKLGYKVIVSKVGKGYLGPFKNKKSTEIVGYSMAVGAGVSWFSSQWMF